MDSQRAFTKINLQKKGDVFLMSQYEPQKKLTLKVVDIKQNKSYLGQASEIELRQQAARIRLTYKDFISKIIKAFFEVSWEESNFLYSLEKENEVYLFKWKIIDHEETVINLGYIDMTEQDYVSAFTGVLLEISKEMRELNLKTKTLQLDLDESKNQINNVLDQLSEAVRMKEKQENEMITKFALLLNEKKKKIREMSNNNCSNDLSRIKENCKSIKLIPKKSKPHIMSSSDEEIVSNKPGPSTHMKRNALFLDDIESEPDVPVKSNKKRNRKPIIKKRCASPNQEKISKAESIAACDSDSDESLMHNL